MSTDQEVRIAELEDSLQFVERWAVHHGTKSHMTAENALSMIQHYPPISAITKGYADGKVPETFNPYARITELEAHISELVANLQTQRREYLALQAKLADAQKDAARYRWLRNRPEDQDIFIGVDSHKYPSRWSLLGEYADYVIDAEMKDTIDAARAGEVT